MLVSELKLSLLELPEQDYLNPQQEYLSKFKINTNKAVWPNHRISKSCIGGIRLFLKGKELMDDKNLKVYL